MRGVVPDRMGGRVPPVAMLSGEGGDPLLPRHIGGGVIPSGKKREGGRGITPLPPVRKRLTVCMAGTGISCGNIGKGGRLINEGEDAQTGAPVSVAWAWARWIIQNNLALRNNYLKYSSLSSIFFTTVIPFPSCA